MLTLVKYNVIMNLPLGKLLSWISLVRKFCAGCEHVGKARVGGEVNAREYRQARVDL